MNTICICSTHRDHRELLPLKNGHSFIFHEYASNALEDLTAPDRPPGQISIDDPQLEVETLLRRCTEQKIQAVISTDDYPGSTVASVVADRLSLLGPKPAANLLCQHKYYCRCIQAQAAPEATPGFGLIDVRNDQRLPPEDKFPLFVKPVKSFFSVGAQRVETQNQLAEIKKSWRQSAAFFEPFEVFLRKHTGLSIGTSYLVAEELLSGIQVTLDGYVCGGQTHTLGIVDSIMFAGTIAFKRFEYPSSLPASIQERMAGIAGKVMPALGFDNGQFNIEFMYNPEADAVHIVEINPRMSSQFADLFEKVDGTNSYSVLLDLAEGRTPKVRRRQGRHRAAFSCVLRTFQNQKVRALPSREQIERLQGEFPDIRVEILATEGRKLSEQMQDTCSYRYGLINLGGRDRNEILERFDYCQHQLSFDFEPA